MPRTEPYDPNSALVLSVLLGGLGIDRFYTGHTGRGLGKLFTLGGLGIWWLVDIVLFIGEVRRAGRDARATAAQSAPAPSAPATEGARVPPAPTGNGLEPWARASTMTEVIGEHHRPEAFAHLMDGLPQNGSSSKVERTAALSLDPHDPHERGAAVAVWIEGRHVGFLARQNAGRFAPLLAGMAERSQHLTVGATITGRYDRRRERWTADVNLELPEPELILPLNAMPEQEHVLLPAGDSVQVTGEAGHMAVLAPLTGTGPRPHAATLHALSGERSGTIEVRIDGRPVGVLPAASAGSVGPLIELVTSRGLVPVARATVRGTTHSAEVALTLAHGSQVDPQWLAQIDARPLFPRRDEGPAGH